MSKRYPPIDALRGAALLLGVVWHAAQSFVPHNYSWAVVDSSPSRFLEWFMFGCHSFRMELFFLIAGFFARAMVVRRGVAGFVKNRVRHIAIPLVVGWVLLYPILVLIWLWGRSHTGFMDDLGIPRAARHFPIRDLWLGFLTQPAMLRVIGLSHLWFLHQLLTIYAMALGVRWLMTRLGMASRIADYLDTLFARAESVSALTGLAIVSTPLLLFMKAWTTDTPIGITPNPQTTAFFGLCFTVGWFLHRQPWILNQLVRSGGWLLGIAMIHWCTFGVLGRYLEWQMTPAALGMKSLKQWHLVRAIWFFGYAVMMWSFVLGFFGLFCRWFQRPNAWMRYLADSSYWVYIIHFPLVAALQIIAAPIPLPWPLKYPLISVVASVLLLSSYHYLVRGTFLGLQLNGHRYPREWPWQGKTANAAG